MGVVSRTLDSSLQRIPIPFTQIQSITSGETGVLAYVPFPCQIQAAQAAAFSVESNAYLMFTVSRFIVGSGFTSYILGSSFTPNSFGTSGVLTNGISLPAVGNTLMNLMPNDVLGYQVGGGSTAGIFGLVGSFVVTATQDIRAYLSGLA